MAKPHGFVQRLHQAIIDLNLEVLCPELSDTRFQLEQGMIDEHLARDLLLLYDPMIQQAIDHPNFLRRPPTVEELYADGPPDIEVGALVHAESVRFGIRLRDRPRNILVSGNAGSGKTTLISNIVEAALRDQGLYRLRIFEKKRSYRGLFEQHRESSQVGDVHDEETKISFAAPSGMSPKAWFNIIASLFCATAGLIAAWTCMARMMNWLFEVLNRDNTKPKRWPNLRLLLQLARSVPLTTWAPKADYEKSLINQLDAAVQSTTLFDCCGGGVTQIDSGKHLFLEMHDMEPTWVRVFAQSLLFAYELYGSIYAGLPQTKRTIFVLDDFDDDATSVLDERFQDSMSVLSRVMRLGREFGIMAVIGLGRLQGVSRFVLSEAQYHFLFNQSDASSMRMASATLGLPPAADPMFPGLRPGYCIARVAQCSWEHPMLVKIDERPQPIAPLSWECDTLPVIEVHDLHKLPEFRQAIAQLLLPTNDTEKLSRQGLSEHAFRLLHTAAANLWAPAAFLWRRSGKIPAPATQIAVCRELHNTGLAESEQTRIGSANVLLYRITAQGWAYLSRNSPTHQGAGTITHQSVSNWYAMFGKLDSLKSYVEWTDPHSRHRVDAAIQVDTNLFDVAEVIVEAESNIVHHLSVLSTSPFVRNITIIRTQKQLLKETQAQVSDEPIVKELGASLQWALAESFMRRCFP